MAMGDGGGRAANNGGMSGGSSGTGSRGGSRGGNSSGASPGRSTPGSPSAADGNRGSTMGAKGGSAGPAGNSSRGGPGLGVGLDGGLNGGFGTDIGKDPGPSGGLKKSSSAGESIAGSKDARTSFDGGKYAVTNPVTARESYRAKDMGTLANESTNPVVGGSFIGADNSKSRFSFSDNLADNSRSGVSIQNNKRVQGNAALSTLTRDAKNMGLGGQLATTAAGMVLGPIGGFMAEAVRNNMVAGELSKDIQSLNARTDMSYNANQGDLAKGLNTNTLSDTTFGLLGDVDNKGLDAVANKPQPAEGMMNLSPTDISPADAQRLAEQSRVNWGPSNEREGSNNDIQEIPIPKVAGNATPNASKIGNVGNYASYARNVFSTV